MRIRFSLGILAVFFSLFSIHAQLIRTVHVNNPGTLSSLLGGDKNLVTGLTLTGTINDADFQTIKEMNLLKDLDMSAMNIENGKIPDYAFQGRVMDRIVLPETLINIGFQAFFRCTVKEKLVLPTSLKTIMNNAFQEINIQGIDFTKCTQLESIGRDVFAYSHINESLDFAVNNKLNVFESTFGLVNNHIILPRNLKSVTYRTFHNFTGTVDLPPSIETIEFQAFFGCTIKEKLVLPASLKTIMNNAFQEINIQGIDFTKCIQLESIGRDVFAYSRINESLDFAANNKLNVFESTFRLISNHVILPRNLKNLSNLAFSDFSGTVDLPPVLETIEFQAFFRSTIKEKLVLPASLKTIMNNAFQEINIQGIDFTKCIQLESIGKDAFAYSRINESLDFAVNNKLNVFESTFRIISNHVILPRNLKSLSNFAFSDFSGTVDLSPVLETIEFQAFFNSTIKEINLPASLQQIETNAFNGCTQLNTIICLAPIPPSLGNTVFYNVNKQTCKLYVPKGTVPLYQAADQWKDFLIEEYSISLTGNLAMVKQTDPNLYKVKTGEEFNISLNASIITGIRIGLFYANGIFAEDIVKSENGNGIFTCSISTDILSGSYIIQPYIIEDGEKVIVSRRQGSHIIDRLPVTVTNNWDEQTRSVTRAASTEINNHLLINTGQADLLEVASGKEFNLLLRYTAPASDIRIGLFNPENGLLMEGINQSVSGNVFTCKVPATIPVGKYTLIPYQVVNGNNVFIERQEIKPYMVDRLPLNIIEGTPEPTGNCLTIEVRDNASSTLLVGGKYRITGNGIDESYLPIEGEDHIIINNLPDGEYTITEVYPPTGYKTAANSEQTISINESDECTAITFRNGMISSKIDLTYKIGIGHINSSDQNTHENGTIEANYEGVRIGEYYWMNSDFNHEEPFRIRWATIKSGEEVKYPLTQAYLNKYMEIVLLDKSQFQVDINTFTKYYGVYYSQYSRDYMSDWGKIYENGSDQATNWSLPYVRDFRQLAAMCPFNTVYSAPHTSLNSHDVLVALGAKTGDNPMTNIVIPGECGSTYWFGNNTNQYNFNMMPGGARLNGDGDWRTYLCKGGFINPWGLKGDIYHLFYTAKYPAIDGSFDFWDKVDTNSGKSSHWTNIRWCRRLSDEELGYKLYIKVDNINTSGVEWTNLIGNDEIPLLLAFKENRLNVNDVSIMKTSLTEQLPVGYTELPNGYIRGFYVQHILEKINPSVSIADIIRYSYSVIDNALGNENRSIQVQAETNIGFSVLNEGSEAVIYPNPVSDILYIKSDNIQQVEIYDLTGRLLIKENTSSINVNNLKPGIYIVKVTTADGVTTHKVSKK